MSEKRRKKLDLLKIITPLFAVSLVLIAANIVVFLFWTSPRLLKAQKQEEKITKLNRDIESAERELGRVRSTKQELTRTLGDMEKFYDEMLSSKLERMTLIQKEFRNIATKFGIDMERVSYSHAIKEDSNIVEFQISVPLEGTYENLRQFIYEVERSEHFFIIDRISLTGGRETGEILKLKISLLTYFKREGAESLKALIPYLGAQNVETNS